MIPAGFPNMEVMVKLLGAHQGPNRAQRRSMHPQRRVPIIATYHEGRTTRVVREQRGIKLHA